MSEQQAKETSLEEKFFGTRTQITPGVGNAADGAGDSDFKIEVVDDLPPEQKPKAAPNVLHDDDDELTEYSAGVKKRIDKLTFQREEAKRQMAEANQMREEAIRVAKQLSDQNRQYHQTITQGEAQLVDRTKAAATYAVQQAKMELTQAHETGDTEKLVAAQERLNFAQNELQRAMDYEQDYNFRRGQQQHARQQRPQPQIQPRAPAQPKVDPKAKSWAEENPWFQSEEHKDMTALAYGVHEQLVMNGVDPSSDEYFQSIDATMRQRFPDYFGEAPDGDGSGRQPVSPSRKPSQVVAPSSRNNGGANPRSVKLTSTQAALAKRLGLTNEQYAKQLVKENL